MKKDEILNIILCGVIILVGGYLVIKLIKWLLKLIAAGASTLLVLAYIFAPLIIIVLLIMILVRMRKK